MSIVRSILVMLMLACLLPLGAYKTGLALSAAKHSLVSAALTDAGSTDDLRVSTVAPKPCHGSGPQGFACGPILGMPPEADTFPEFVSLAAFVRSDDMSRKGRTPSGFLDPPRFG